ncbi:MAG: glycosyl hydrolase family 2 [Verrucomicrobia bacterium]|nr:glycosyl hydrolase family 2 [Verrucomicrobiota bacterium]
MFLLLAGFLRAEGIEKIWYFTTVDTLTLDLRLAAGNEPDWKSSTVRLARVGGSEPAQEIPLHRARVTARPVDGVTRLTLTGLEVSRWEPSTPTLYQVTLDLATRQGRRERREERIGFRSFTTERGRLCLNGRPYFLRGLAINPPNRGIPEKLERSRAFAEDYVRYLRSLNVNIIRIPDDETWYDVCDELGMLVFGGNYGGSVNGANASGDRAAAARWFRETKFHPIAHHPALVIYALTNEVAGEGASGARWDGFLGAIHGELQPWDPTRLYIANAGYGYGRVGEINDLHRYWGWYYQSPFTFLHLRDDPRLVAPGRVQPLTFTECVGNYLGPDGRTNLTPNHKNPVAQLSWTGHAPTAELGQLGFAHQSFTVRQATELFRRLRPHNPELSGVFPFTILFNRWHDIASFADMDPKPAARQLRTSYQPVLLSWELYTPQVYAGAELRPIAHVVNDADPAADLRDLRLEWELRDATQRAVASGREQGIDVPYYGTSRRPLAVTIPAHLPTGSYRLWGRLHLPDRSVAENETEVFIASTAYSGVPSAGVLAVALADAPGRTRAALERLGIGSTPVPASETPPLALPVFVGEDTVDRLDPATVTALTDWVRRGGRLVVLRQPAASAPALQRLLPAAIRMPSTSIDDPSYPPPARPSRDGLAINPERPDHPILVGLDRRRLQVWSDPNGWDETKPGLPRVHPVTNGLVLRDPEAIRDTAVLANYSQGLEGIALAEFFAGQGSVLYSGFDLVDRIGRDPVADRLLRNLVAYAALPTGHERHVLIEAPIVWGQYETERGVLTGIHSGLMLNSRPALTGSYRDTLEITVTAEGHQFAGGPGGWNNRPGIVYVPFGRRPFGPYVHRDWSGTPELAPGAPAEGRGRFWCRVPAGRTAARHHVFNPSGVPLAVHLSANDRETSAVLAPGATEVIEVPLDAKVTTVETRIRGDRRLVLLESAFR